MGISQIQMNKDINAKLNNFIGKKFNKNSIEDLKIEYQMIQRSLFIHDCFTATVNSRYNTDKINSCIELIKQWMINGTDVRILGAGRARLAGALPANRLKHGGANVFVQNDIIPMPHTIRGGGVIAVSASGKTKDVIEILQDIKKKEKDRISIIGIAGERASKKFINSCTYFIKIVKPTTSSNTLEALADIGEQVINLLLDALIVAAGKKAEYDDTKWRLGHENIGATGPYEFLGYSKESSDSINVRESSSSYFDMINAISETNRKVYDDFKNQLHSVSDNERKYIYWMFPRIVEKTKDESDNLKSILQELFDLTTSSHEEFDKYFHGMPFDFFLALGLVRDQFFDEVLLAYLWDCFGNGNTKLFRKCLEKIKDFLLNKGLLVEVKKKNAKGLIKHYRLKSRFHMDLYNLVAEHFNNRTAIIHYYIAEYFRDLVVNQTSVNKIKCEYLENYIYHSLSAGNHTSVFNYIFDRNMIELFHNKVFALYFYPSILLFEIYYSSLLKSGGLREAGSNIETDYGKILVEIGRVYIYLTRHSDAIKILKDAKEHLLKENKPTAFINNNCCNMYHLSANSYSQQGFMKETIENYYKEVFCTNSLDKTSIILTPQNLLSIGYYAYELKFSDINQAEEIGIKSVEACKVLIKIYKGDNKIDKTVKERKIKQIEVINAKNLCSLGQIQGFIKSGLKTGKTNFEKGLKILENLQEKRSREYGRMLVNYSVALIGTANYYLANQKLEEALSLYNNNIDDQRRRNMAVAYKGIIKYHDGKIDQAKNYLFEAMIKHKDGGTIREMIYEALSYIYISNDHNEFTDLLIGSGVSSLDLSRYIEEERLRDFENAFYLIEGQYLAFVEFWLNNYKIVLLDK